jgi:hypothetical protein
MAAQLAERTHIRAELLAARTRPRSVGASAAGVAAAASVALLPLWWHVTFVDPHIDNITAVFSTLAIYPSDACLLLVAAGLLGSRITWQPAVVALLLPAAALLSVAVALERQLAVSVGLHLALLGAAWLALRLRRVPATWIVAALVGAASVQSLLAVAQFVAQQPLVPGWLGLPWLPGPDVSVGGTPVVLSAEGTRLFRGFGTFPHPNVLAGYVALALVASPSLGGRWWVLAPVLAAGLFVTFSRSGWLAACLGVSIWLAAANVPHGWKLAIVAASALALTGLLLSPLGPTLGGRIWPWSANALERGSIGNRLQLDADALMDARTHLPLGVGGGNFGVAAVRDGFQVGWGEPAPNVALLIATELGAPGILAGLTLLAVSIGAVSRAGPARVPAVAVCCALLVLAMLDHYLWTMPPGRVMAWLSFALVVAQRAQSEPRRAQSR